MHIISIISLALGAICAIIIAFDELSHPQRMWIMDIVWPVTALFGSVIWLGAYFHYGRLSTRDKPKSEKPMAAMTAIAASHCGAGCTLGDIVAEWTAFFVPAIAVAFGWHSIFGDKIFANWVFDYICAYIFGIVFQYFTIAPMRGLSFFPGIWAAVKADTLSLTAWQLGMYGFMAIAKFWIFRDLLNRELPVNSDEFWFMMQIAMLCGFATSFPVNWWLLRAGLKEKM